MLSSNIVQIDRKFLAETPARIDPTSMTIKNNFKIYTFIIVWGWQRSALNLEFNYSRDTTPE